MNAKLVIPPTGSIGPETRKELLLRLWGSANLTNEDLRYYASQCQTSLLDGGRRVSVSTHVNVIEIASKIRQGMERANLHQDVSQQLGGGAPNDTGTLRDFTEKYFGPGAGVKLQPDKPQIGRIFTALNLRKIGGMRIEWMRNLADHLRLMDDNQTASIFDCVAFLKFQRKVHRPMFPPSFIDETLQTLSLLVPQNVNKAQEWIESQIEDHDLDPLLTECGSLTTHERRVENFNYWNNRLVILKQVLDESRPQTLSQ
ncbi:hypothetical protein F4823DRAFT_561600 [Ustulina deusta]|nr:hypothetical protein F4823DRAFT_561600 [Ustulina deusta]